MTSFSLRTKIIIRLAIMSVCAMSVLLIVMYRYISHTFQADLLNRGRFLAHTISEQSTNPILTQRFLTLALMLHEAKNIDKDLEYLFIVDTHGELLAHTFGENFPSDLKMIGVASKKDFSPIRMNDLEILDISSPLVDGTLGTLHVGMSKSRINGELVRIFFVAAMVITALFLTAAGLLWLSLKRIIIGPIKKLEDIVSNVEKGELGEVVQIVSGDEIGQLGCAFNKMAEHLAVVDSQRTNVIAQLRKANDELTLMIEERELAKVRLADSEERLRLILNSACEGIFGIDSTGSCTFCNLSSLRLLGYSHPDDLVGKTIHEFLHPKSTEGQCQPPTDCRICRTILNGKSIHVDDEMFWRRDCTSFPVEYWSHPQIQSGRIVGTVVTFVDITERRKAEDEQKKLQEMLLQSQKMDAMGILAGGIAHDFNNILAVISGYCEIAKKRCKDDKISGNLDQIAVASNRAADLVRQILTFSRKGGIHRQPLELSPLIKETLKLIRSSIPATIDVRHEIDSSAVALADPTQIHQVLLNLCTNANYAMAEKGGTLTISLRKAEVTVGDAMIGAEIPSGRYAIIGVSDTGCGMDNETKQKIFEPYFTTRENGKGSGLGLAVVHGIVKSHGGRIAVYSEPGVGSRFDVFLPLISHHTSAQPLPVHEQPGEGKGQRIFFVDDEQQIRDVAQHVLTDFGFSVEVYEDAIQVLERLQQDPGACDLLVTDMAMPGMSGKELARAVRALRPDLPIILCSGYSDKLNDQSANEIGVQAYIQKPVLMSTLCDRILKILEKATSYTVSSL